MLKFDHEIIKSFIKLPNPMRKEFFVINNIFMGNDKNITVYYRDPFDEKITISLEEYEACRKAKERNKKLEQLI